MLETWTRLNFSIPAFLSASSKDASLSLWMPTPFVKKIFAGTITQSCSFYFFKCMGTPEREKDLYIGFKMGLFP